MGQIVSPLLAQIVPCQPCDRNECFPFQSRSIGKHETQQDGDAPAYAQDVKQVDDTRVVGDIEQNPFHEVSEKSESEIWQDLGKPPIAEDAKERFQIKEDFQTTTDAMQTQEAAKESSFQQQQPLQRSSSFNALKKANPDDADSIKNAIGEPSMWERFIGAEWPAKAPFCGCVCTVSTVLLLVIVGSASIKMSDVFGFFVLGDEVTQAFFAHSEFLKDRPYFTEVDDSARFDPVIPMRSQPLALATIFIEVKGTKCPGDECNLYSKNAITSKYLGYMQQVEERIWNDEAFQTKYCALLNSTGSRCYPPKSILSLMLWGDGVAPTAASQELARDGYGPRVDATTCDAWQSPFDIGACSSPAWTPASADSGAAAPGDLQSYSNVIDKICTPRGNYWSGLRQAWLPNFACTEDHMKNHGVPFLRSQILFGLPFDKDRKRSEIDYSEQFKDLADEFGSGMFQLQSKIIDDIGDDDVNIVISSVVSSAAERNAMQATTLSFTGLSFFLVFLYMWFSIESFFLASFGMLQVLFSVFPTIIVWNIINSQGIQFLQFLAIFMILGIGADDTFVLNDAWKQAQHELAEAGDLSKIHVFTLAYRRSFFAMLATTMTTAWAFFFGVLNPIPAIADFCVFACIIVIFDFIFCITMFAACVAFHDRYMVGHSFCCYGDKPEPGTCCSPGCCFGGTRILWRKCRNIPADQTTDQRTLELFFSGPLLHFLQGFRYSLIVFWLCVLVSAIASIAIGVKIAEKDPEGLPSDHPLSRYGAITGEYFTTPDPEKVVVIWGLSDKEPVSQWSVSEAQKPTQIKFMDIGAAVSKDGQQKILDLCQAPTAKAGTLRCFDQACLVKGAPETCETKIENGMRYFVDPLCQDGRYCIMEQVKLYADKKYQNTSDQMYEWPLNDFHAVASSDDFRAFMIDTFALMQNKKQHWHAENFKQDSGIVLEESKVKYMWMTFNATFEGRFLPPKLGNQIYDDWQSFIESYAAGTNFHQVHIMYLFKVLQDILVTECFKSIFASLAVAFIVLALVTWNWRLALLGLFNISTIVAYFMGLWPWLGWELDIYNVIFSIMAVGLSVDYTVHILHAYNESEEIYREDRTKSALSSMGITVLSGAITTLLAAFPLLFTIPTFFNRFGSFIFITIFFSIVTSLLFLVPLLLVFGPNGRAGPDDDGLTEMEQCYRFGEIRPLYWLWCRWQSCRKPSAYKA